MTPKGEGRPSAVHGGEAAGRDPEKFLALPAGADPTEIMGPMVFDKVYAQVVRYHEAFEFDPAQMYAGVNAAKIAADILTVKWATFIRTIPDSARSPSVTAPGG